LLSGGGKDQFALKMKSSKSWVVLLPCIPLLLKR
jgi:hypothetical protein